MALANGRHYQPASNIELSITCIGLNFHISNSKSGSHYVYASWFILFCKDISIFQTDKEKMIFFCISATKHEQQSHIFE